jgi:hypothetical protein
MKGLFPGRSRSHHRFEVWVDLAGQAVIRVFGHKNSFINGLYLWLFEIIIDFCFQLGQFIFHLALAPGQRKQVPG